jgi:hypothetical protein
MPGALRTEGNLKMSTDYLGLTKQAPPAHHSTFVPSREEVAKVLEANTGEWFIVGNHDRTTRAETMADRINSGREYGKGHEAIYRQVGREHRVYARKTA